MTNVDERLPLAERLAQHGVRLPEDGVLTDRFLERGAKPLPFSYSIYDAKQTGLLITVHPSGKKVFQLQTRYPGAATQARRAIGVYEWPVQGKKGAATMSLKAAREKAAADLALVKDGKDPADAAREKVEAAQKARQAEALKNKETFAAVAEAYIASRTNRRKAVDAQEIRRMLISAWGTRPVHSIQPDDVKELFKKLVQHAPYDAKNSWGHCVGIFLQAVDDKVLTVSPCASVNKKKLFPKGTIKSRERSLEDEELRAFWAGTEKLGAPYGSLFQLLALTGVRVNELAKARWSELDPQLRKALRDAAQAKTLVDWRNLPDEIKVLRVPASRFKSDRQHDVWLSGDALVIIEQLRRNRIGDYLFSTTFGRPINNLSGAKSQLDAAMLKFLRDAAEERGEGPAGVELPHWKTHDLRRTVRTNLAALRVPFEVAEIVLGHTLGGLHAVYDRHSYAPETREALEKWAAKFREIVTPPPPAPTAINVAMGNVVTMPKQRVRVS